jgi:hypothetical protein
MGREFWVEKIDSTDTGVPIDRDYLRADTKAEPVRDAYNLDAKAVTDGGQPISAKEGDGNGEHYKNRDAVETAPDGFAHETNARTTAFDGRDARGNPTGGWSNKKWRMHMGLAVEMRGEWCDGCEHCEQDDCHADCEQPCAEHDTYSGECPDCSKGCPVCREWCYSDTWAWVAGVEIDNKERDRRTLLDGYLDCFDVPEYVREAVRSKVLMEDVARYWNRHYAGQVGAVVGFMAVETADSPESALADDRLHGERPDALVDDVGQPLEKIVAHGFKRARANGWIE